MTQVSIPFRGPSSGNGLVFGILAFVATALVAFLVIVPLIVIIKEVFFAKGEFNVGAFDRAISDPTVFVTIRNTVVMVAVSGVLAVLIGGAIAWFNERTDAQIPWVAEYLPLIPLMIPNIACVIGWVMLIAPQAGLINVAIRNILGSAGLELTTGPFNVYGWPSLIFVMTIYFIPYSFLMIGAALKNLNSRFEEASRIHGAGPFRTAMKVTLPAVRPAIIASVLLMIIAGFAIFSIPVVIGTGAKIEVLSVRIYRLMFTYSDPPGIDVALVLSIILLLIVQGAMLLQILASRENRHATIGGKVGNTSIVYLGSWRWIVRVFVVSYLLLAAVLPVLGLFLVSLQGFWSPRINWAMLNFANYHKILFEGTTTSAALINSVMLGATAATVAVALSAIFAMYFSQQRGLLRSFNEFVTSLPSAIPHTVIAIGFILVFSRGAFRIPGTLLILGLAYLIIFLPQAQRAASVAFDQVGKELSEASRIFGASQIRTFLKIILPLMMPGLLAGWVLTFVQMAGELTASAMLSGPSNPVIGFVLLNLWENGSFPEVAALAIVITLVDLVVVLAVMRGYRGYLVDTKK